MLNSKKVVSVTRCDGYNAKEIEESISNLLTPLGGMKSFVKRGERVLLKPNLLSAHPPEDAVTTHPQVLKAVAREVLDAGGKPVVGDSPGHGSLKKVAEVSGIKQACGQMDIPLIEFTKEVEVEAENGIFRRFQMANEVLKTDKIINLAKFKTHSQMLLTLAVKNCFGAIVGGEKKRWHLKAGTNRMHFANMLVDICSLVNPDLNIVDSIVGMEGNGPAHGKTRKLNFLIAGRDSFAVDWVGAKLVGLSPMRYHVLKVAWRRGLFNPEEVEISGEWEDFVVGDFKLPTSAEPLIPFVPDFLLGQVRKLTISKPIIEHKKCQKCGVCEEKCPIGAIKQKNERIIIKHAECISCFCCQELCPEGAIGVKEGILARFF